MKIKPYLFFLLFTTTLFAQKVTTTIDSTKKKIGSEFQLTLKTEVDTITKVVFPKAKNFGALEVIESYKIDTIKKNDKYELIKRYGLTQFDSGKYTIPRLQILIKGKPVFSDSIKVEVSNIKIDTLKQKMYDIKEIIPVETPSNWWKYLIFFGILLGIGYLIYWYIKKRQSQEKPEEIVFKTPIEKATTLLQQLEKKELWQKGEVKTYYSELTDIARNYIEEEIQIPAMESTTSELVLELKKVAAQKKLKLSKETLENLETVLKQADLVKFAKVKPLDFEIEEDKKRISNTIVTIHKSIPVITEEVDDELLQWNEQQKEIARLQKLKKQKQKRIFVALGVVVSVLVTTFVFMVVTKGFDYVKDTFLGHPTKELMEGEWVYSEYGNPSIKIETPKVLKRMDASKMLPPKAMALFKEMQMFGYGSFFDHFYVMISTVKLKQQTEVNLDKAVEGSIKGMELQGAQNIILKTEDFDTQKGISGKKAYGTMTILDKANSKSVKMYYECLFFSQEGGLQQILIMHEEEDTFGKQITERVLNSVELQKSEEQ